MPPKILFNKNQFKSERSPQLAQSDVKSGVYIGDIVDVRDPYLGGGARVHVYSLYGDYDQLKIESIPWAILPNPVRGGHGAPEWGDRAIISFDAGGQRYNPVILAYWKANPNGSGKLSFNKPTGTEVRPEAWNFHDLYPETLLLAASGEGCTFHFDNIQLSENDLLSAIKAEDTGGKYFKLWSFHPNTFDYAAVEKIDPNDSLADMDMDPPNVTRTGLEPVTDPVLGAIEYGHQNSYRSTVTDNGTNSVDSMIQLNSDSTVGAEIQSISGTLLKQAQGQASLVMNNGSVFISGKQAFLNKALIVPRRWTPGTGAGPGGGGGA